jgi:hypothetical protein
VERFVAALRGWAEVSLYQRREARDQGLCKQHAKGLGVVEVYYISRSPAVVLCGSEREGGDEEICMASLDDGAGRESIAEGSGSEGETARAFMHEVASSNDNAGDSEAATAGIRSGSGSGLEPNIVSHLESEPEADQLATRRAAQVAVVRQRQDVVTAPSAAADWAQLMVESHEAQPTTLRAEVAGLVIAEGPPPEPLTPELYLGLAQLQVLSARGSGGKQE